MSQQTLAGIDSGVTAEEMNWPNFYAVGPPRSGTTSLYAYLRNHPEVFLPKVKEVNYFSTRTDMSFEHYQHLYRKAKGYRAIGDISPHYLWDENAPRRIRAASPEAKIIFTLRDPVARAHSHFLLLRRTGLDSEPSFERALRRLDKTNDTLREFSREYVELGLYCGHVKRYLDVFGPDQVLVLLLDDLTRDPQSFFAGLANYLGIDPAPLEKETLAEPRNAFRTPRFSKLYQTARKDTAMKRLVMQTLPRRVQHWLRESPMLYAYDAERRPQLDDVSRRLLQDIYDPEIRSLEQLLGRNLPELRRSWA
jgi:hypothetical protein